MSCVENVYVEVNMYTVILPSHWEKRVRGFSQLYGAFWPLSVHFFAFGHFYGFGFNSQLFLSENVL